MPKAIKIPESESEFQIQFLCPGCGDRHAINKSWQFNNDFEKPTFRPSVLVRGWLGKKNGMDLYGTCHSFVTNGQIEFLSDCTHELAGETVTLPNIE